MNEALVQWVMLKRPEYLAGRLGFDLGRRLGVNYTTDQGRIDFAFENERQVSVVELETAIDSRAKFDQCTAQMTRYRDIPFATAKPVVFVILYDEYGTPDRFVKLIRDFAERMNILLRTYSILDAQDLYKKCMQELERTTGAYIGPPAAMDVVYLRWLNKVIEPFHMAKADRLPFDELRGLFRSRTSFGVYTTLAKHFELLLDNRPPTVELTAYGQRFRDSYNVQIVRSRAAMPDLAMEQKRVLLESLTNGIFTKSKVNLYYFLRFVHLTDGAWVPKSGTAQDNEKLRFVNLLFGKTYRWSTVRELLLFSCNQCEELDLVERIHLQRSDYDRVILLTLGSRVLGYLELFLHLMRERIQIPLQV